MDIRDSVEKLIQNEVEQVLRIIFKQKSLEEVLDTIAEIKGTARVLRHLKEDVSANDLLLTIGEDDIIKWLQDRGHRVLDDDQYWEMKRGYI